VTHYEVARIAGTTLPWRRQGAGKGCANWQVIQDGSGHSREATVHGCGYRCLQHYHCTGFGWQEDRCEQPEGNGPEGQCLMWNGYCDMKDNACWDDYAMDGNALTSPGKGTLAYRYPDLWWAYEPSDGGRLDIYPYWVDAATTPNADTPCPSDWPPTSIQLTTPIESKDGNTAKLEELVIFSCKVSVKPEDLVSDGKLPVPVETGGDTVCYSSFYYVDNPHFLNQKFCNSQWKLPTHCDKCAR